MEGGINNSIENIEIEKLDIEISLRSLSEEDWERAGWPLITIAPKDVYPQEGQKVHMKFWEKVFLEKNFLYPNSKSPYDPEKHFIFVLHSLPNAGNSQEPEIFKAIYTTPKSLLKNPAHMINYKLHGEPCENRSRGSSFYPEINFWEGFHDRLNDGKENFYRIPSEAWRKKFILEKYFGK